jgi:hypothetical protein
MSAPLYSSKSEGYDTLFAGVSRLLIPALPQAARIASGHHVLNVAMGTGAAAQAAAAIVGPTGHVRLPQELRQIVREEVRQTLPQPAPGEPLVINIGVLIGSGRT